MSVALTRTASSECASDLRLDAWLAGELDEAVSARLAVHLAACARCRERKAALERDRARFARSKLAVPAFADPPPVRAFGTGRRRLRPLGFATLAAAACALLAVVSLQSASGPAGVRGKGEPHLHFFVKRGELVQRGARGDALLPGDQLRFAYTAGGARYLAILSVDGAGQASVYFPAAARAVAIGPGTEVPLPSAVELDRVLGDEHIVGLFCDTPVLLAPLSAQLRAHPQAFAPPSGCTVDRLQVSKRAPPP